MKPFFDETIETELENAHLDVHDEAMADWRELKEIRDQVRSRGLVQRSEAQMVQDSYGVEVSRYPALNNYSEFPATDGLESFLSGVDNAVEERALTYIRTRLGQLGSIVSHVRGNFQVIDPSKAARALKAIPVLNQAVTEIKALFNLGPDHKDSDTIALTAVPAPLEQAQQAALNSMSEAMTELVEMVFVRNPELIKVVSHFEVALLQFLEDFHLRIEYVAKVLERANSEVNDDVAAIQLTHTSRNARLESIRDFAVKQAGLFRSGDYNQMEGEIFLWTIADQIGTVSGSKKENSGYIPPQGIVDILANSNDHRVQFPARPILLNKELAELEASIARLVGVLKVGAIRERAELLKPLVDSLWVDVKVLVSFWKYLSLVIYARDRYVTATAQALLMQCRLEAVRIQQNSPHNVDAVNKIIQDVNRAMK